MRYNKENGDKNINIITNEHRIDYVLAGLDFNHKRLTNESCRKYTDVSSLRESLKQLKKTLNSKGVQCIPEQEVLIREGSMM